MGTYLKIALRNLYREKLYAAINIAGLSIAIASCIVLGLYLYGELTYDRHHANHRKIFRVANEFNIGGAVNALAVSPSVLGEMLKEAYPEIEDYVTFQTALQGTTGGVMLRHDRDAYYWDDAYWVDANVFDVFTHEVLYGDPKTALVNGGSIAVSETFARRYFGDANAIGETLVNDNGSLARITLVFADLPPNTHLKYDVLYSNNLPFLQTPDNTTMRRQTLWNVARYTYLVMPENYDPDDYLAINAEFYEENMAELGRSLNATWRSWLEPLADIHYGSSLEFDRPGGNRFYLYGFAAVAVFILLVACINYVNLATARATKRARSVGVRKILGAGRASLIAQFIGEAVLFALIAGTVGIVIVEVALALVPVESLVGKPLSLNLTGQPLVGAAILALSLIVGLFAGLYPALYLSSWAPLTALVGRSSRAGKASVRFRQVLVFTQFVISIAVIAATLLMSAQMRFIADRGLGFEQENRIMITLRGAGVIERIPTIENRLSGDPHILGVTTSQFMMGHTTGLQAARVENNTGTQQLMTVSNMPVGDDFLEVMGISLAAGRDFSRRLLTDIGTGYIVNEAFVRTMGWDEPLGKRITLGRNSGRVIGVVKDFNFKSLHTAVEPFLMYRLPENLDDVQEIFRPFIQRLLVLNIAGEDIGLTLRMLEGIIAEFDPTHPFELEFIDDSLDELYTSERQLMRLIAVFAGLCIFIACLGLFGLAAFTTEQRTKEIGIRKVLGASAGEIIMMLAKGTLVLVLAAAFVASGIAYLAIDEWLAGFAYRAPINPLVFVLATALAAVVAYATIALQSYNTARADPVDALRYE